MYFSLPGIHSFPYESIRITYREESPHISWAIHTFYRVARPVVHRSVPKPATTFHIRIGVSCRKPLASPHRYGTMSVCRFLSNPVSRSEFTAARLYDHFGCGLPRLVDNSDWRQLDAGDEVGSFLFTLHHLIREDWFRSSCFCFGEIISLSRSAVDDAWGLFRRTRVSVTSFWLRCRTTTKSTCVRIFWRKRDVRRLVHSNPTSSLHGRFLTLRSRFHYACIVGRPDPVHPLLVEFANTALQSRSI